MEYRVLIKLFVPEIEEVYEFYMPVYKTVDEIARLLNQIVNEMSGVYPMKAGIALYNRRTGVLYPREATIAETDIRNGTELIMMERM